MTAVSSQQVSWEETHWFLQAALAHANAGPLHQAGTPAWCDLADDDPRKLLALAVAGEHHVLRVEVAQTALAAASKAVAEAADWTRVASEYHSRATFYDARPWLKRGAGQ
jgi:hypothetical protein